VLAWAGALSLGLLYLFAFAFGVADAFFQPAMLAIVPGLVDPDELEPSNALLQATGQASEIVGPLAAGLVIATGAIWYAFAIDALSFLFAAVMLLGVRVVRPAAEASAEPAMRIFLLVIAGLNFFMIGPVNAGLPALAALRFGASAGAFGTMLTLFGVGALLGTLAAGALRIGGRMGLMLPAFTGLIGLALIGLGSAPSVLVACAMCAAIGFGISFVNIHILSWLQRRTPPELLGRVMSVVVAAALGLDPFSRAVAGLAIDWSTSAMFAVAGAGILAITLLAASSRAVRSIG
jgi:MFS family permease